MALFLTVGFWGVKAVDDFLMVDDLHDALALRLLEKQIGRIRQIEPNPVVSVLNQVIKNDHVANILQIPVEGKQGVASVTA